MEQTPTLPMESAFQRPNRGQDALAPGSRLKQALRPGARASRPRTARSAVPSSDRFPVGKARAPWPNRGQDALAPPDPANWNGVSRQRNSNANRRFAPSRPRTARSAVPSSDRFPVGKARAPWPNRGQDALAPPDPANWNGVSRQRNSNANRRFAPSRPRTARSAVPSSDRFPVGKARAPWPNRGQDALAPPDPANWNGVSRQRNSNANRRFAPSRPRTARSAVPSSDRFPVGKALAPCTSVPFGCSLIPRRKPT